MLTILVPAVICLCQTTGEEDEWWSPVLRLRAMQHRNPSPRHSLRRAGAAATVLVCCASAPSTWPHWVIPVVASVPLGTPALWLDRGFDLSLISSLGCDIIQNLQINIQSNLRYILQPYCAFLLKNPAGSLLWQQVDHEENPWLLLTSTETHTQCTQRQGLDCNAAALVQCQVWGNNTSSTGRLISLGTLC